MSVTGMAGYKFTSNLKIPLKIIKLVLANNIQLSPQQLCMRMWPAGYRNSTTAFGMCAKFKTVKPRFSVPAFCEFPY
jgi:hypothetical protein